MLLTALFEQAAYQIYHEGFQGSAIGAAAQDTPATLSNISNKPFQLRVRIQEIGGGVGAVTDDFSLQFALNGGSWTDVSGVTTGVRSYDSALLTDGSLTTKRLSGGTGTFNQGEVAEDSTVDDYGVPANEHTEFLWSLELVAADTAAGDTFTFRILGNGTVLDTYTVTPTVIVSKAEPFSAEGTLQELIPYLARCCCGGGSGSGSGSGDGSGGSGSGSDTRLCCQCQFNQFPDTLQCTIFATCIGTRIITLTRTDAGCFGNATQGVRYAGSYHSGTTPGSSTLQQCWDGNSYGISPVSEDLEVVLSCLQCPDMVNTYWRIVFHWGTSLVPLAREVFDQTEIVLVSCDPLTFAYSGTVDCVNWPDPTSDAHECCTGNSAGTGCGDHPETGTTPCIGSLVTVDITE